MIIRRNDLNDELVMEIGKFAILWNIFESDYFDKQCTPEKIKSACTRLSIDKIKQSNLAKALNERRSWFGQLYIDYIKDNLYSDTRKPSEDKINAIENFLKQEGDNLIYGCLLSVQRIRNNLMHGLKCVEELNSQLDLFKAVNDVLECVKEKINE